MAILEGVQITKELSGKLRTAGIDIYCWKGLTCIRRWPRPPQQPRTVKQVAWWNVFRQLSQAYAGLSIADRTRLREEARPFGWTGRALFLHQGLVTWKLLHPQYV